MLEMSSGLGTATMSIGVSHSNPTSDNITSGCRLRAQSQGQQQTPQQSHQQQSQSQQQTLAQSDQTLQECQQPSSGQKDPRPNPPHGRSKKDNCCLCWWCCCSCSWNKCLAVVGTGNGTSGTGDSKKKRGNGGTGPDSGSGGGHTDPNSGTGNVLDSLDGIDGTGTECCGLDEVRSWGSSFDKLMRSATGRKLFREFLMSEYSEENIAFWLACEQLKRENNPEKIEEKARYIYEDYISILSPKEVSLDSRVREIVNRNMIEPTPHTFDEAQLQIYTLMHRDSYPRFVNSDIFRRAARIGSGPPSPAEDTTEIIGGAVPPGIPTSKSKSKKSIS
ncbi:regulator of G-protein signaling 19 isoform X1 [Cotesia glomerata]|uniref:regulator of G-protein signaling 19 isoform X1 n=1 Tax=Cotesia glomerata TaxID=32391 RepID=UPI001D025583|nr:regulator of G-protein signaling 19 isoform X1 [Cotesia glomerata]XP_044588094.1 regulator of G-protein signaling 19 isoform X1 [Cotesia glomerata]